MAELDLTAAASKIVVDGAISPEWAERLLRKALPEIRLALAKQAEDEWLHTKHPECQGELTLEHVVDGCPAYRALAASEWLEGGDE